MLEIIVLWEHHMDEEIESISSECVLKKRQVIPLTKGGPLNQLPKPQREQLCGFQLRGWICGQFLVGHKLGSDQPQLAHPTVVTPEKAPTKASTRYVSSS